MTATDLMNEPIHPTRVLPTEADVADAIEKSDWPTDGRATRLDHPNAYLRRARAVLALFASQPTVAQVKAEALRELLEPIRELAEIGDSCWLSEGTRVVRVTTRKNGYTETESMIRVSDLEGLLDQIEADVKGGER